MINDQNFYQTMSSITRKALFFKKAFRDVGNFYKIAPGTSYGSGFLTLRGSRALLSAGSSSGPDRWFSQSRVNASPLHFDTHSLVTKLEGNGYSKQQAEVMSNCLHDVLSLCLKDIHDTNVSKIDQERLEMKLLASINEIKKEMFLLEQSKFSKMKEENERLKENVKAVEKLLGEEIAKLISSTKLDLSLEKSRTREELAIRDQRIKDNANKIETEIAKLGTLMETQKLDLIKYLVGSLLSISTVVLAIWRFLKT